MKLFRVRLVRCYLGDQEEPLMISQVLFLLKIIGIWFTGPINLVSGSVLISNDFKVVYLLYRSYIKSEAVLKIMEYIDLPFPQLAFFLHFMPL